MTPQVGDIWIYTFTSFHDERHYLFTELLFDSPTGQKWNALCLDDGQYGVAHYDKRIINSWRFVA